jgi:hypothetical protein
MHLLTALSAVLAISVTAAAETPSNAPTSAAGSESLGSQLLDDLAPTVPPKPATRKGDQWGDSEDKDPASRAAPRFDDLGEDTGQPSGPLSLVRVRQGMQRAESLLGQPAATGDAGTLDKAATVQRHVVDQLDQLIAELSKQCQGGQCQPGDQPPSPSQPSQTKPGNSTSAVSQGQTAARDSTDRLNSAGAKPVDRADIDELAKQLWGHLPERERERMMQSFSEEFLPKYEREIEDYYRRLSEERKANGAQQSPADR